MTALAERIDHLHRSGLDSRYDDVLGFEDVPDGLTPAIVEADRSAFLTAGPAYDYVNQRWMAHPDHAHMSSRGDLPLVFCGADRTTCVGLPPVGMPDLLPLVSRATELAAEVRAFAETATVELGRATAALVAAFPDASDTRFDKATEDVPGYWTLHELIGTMSDLLAAAVGELVK